MVACTSGKSGVVASLSFKTITAALRDFSFPRCDVVIGIANGGIVPACLVAYRLHCDVRLIQIAYRSEENVPIFSEPQLIRTNAGIGKKKNLLIVDDVAQSGKTLQVARRLFSHCHVHTMVFKGNADFVLFPGISSCVQWPWKIKDRSK